MSSESQDPRIQAQHYMKLHKIEELFEELGTLILHYRPSNIRLFLKQQLSIMQHAKQSGEPHMFFNDQDLLTMYNIFDVTKKGEIDLAQYYQALRNLGIATPAVELPEGTTTVNRNTFMQYAAQELKIKSATGEGTSE